MRKLWNDECGAVVSAELVMVMTILGIGMIVGLKTLQASVAQEQGDVAQAIGKVDQGYAYAGLQSCDQGGMAGAAGSSWTDAEDTCIDDETGDPKNPVIVTVGPGPEGGS